MLPPEPALHFALLFLVAVRAVLARSAARLRLDLPAAAEDFFRACGRNLWRFIRLMIVAGIVMGVVAGALFALHGMLEKKAERARMNCSCPMCSLRGLRSDLSGDGGAAHLV